MIDPQTIERIKDSADILDVVSEFISLKRVGSNYRGLCPFHDDHSPSFYVSPARGTCKCFVCGEGGDTVSFIMKHEQLSYPDALRWLAKRYNIEIREEQLTEEQRKAETDREGMFLINEWAMKYFKDILHNDIDGRAIGLQYFRSRGFRDDIIERFQLGFSLADRHALGRKAMAEGRSAEYLTKVGLCFESGQKDTGEDDKPKHGQLIDRFAGRAIFPWIGVSGKVVAFGGRVLDSRTKGVDQKYVNSPDSIVYHKDHELYGIFQAKRAIGKEDCVYMVEGYTDVISMHQCGIENVVANSGTALSTHQIHLLHRYTSNIVLLYDGDGAGIKAALRGTDMLLQDGMNVKVLLLPDGDDPDSFARKHSSEEFKAYVEANQTDFIEFKTRVLLQGVTDPAQRRDAINSIIQSVSMISDPIMRATYVKDCSARLGIPEQTLYTTLNDFIRQGRQAATNRNTDTPQREDSAPANAQTTDAQPNANATNAPLNKAQNTKETVIQTNLIEAVIRYGEYVIFDNIETEDGNSITLNVAQFVSYDLTSDGLSFNSPLYNQILNEAVEHSADEGFEATKYFIKHHNYEISNLACQLSEDPVRLSKSLEMKIDRNMLCEHVKHLILDFRKEYINNKMNMLRTEIGLSSGNPEKQFKLMAEYKNLQDIRNAYAKKNGNRILG